jgi:hypothetical protein
MAVTGPKTDLWLVKTVGALLIPISLTMAFHLIIKADWRPVALLGITSNLAFMSIDIYYSLTDTISDIYLADAAVQLCLLIGWVWVVCQRNNHRQQTNT